MKPFSLLPLLVALQFHRSYASHSEVTARALQRANHLASRADTAITPEISELAQGLVNQGAVPGMTVAFVRIDNGTITTEIGAWGNRTEEGDPASPETLFAIGSCSKTFFTGTLAILMDDFANGRNATPLPDGVTEFTFDTKVQDLFPGDDVWKLMDAWATEKANLRDLLSHMSGIPSHEFSYSRGLTPLELTKRLRYLTPGYEFREQWSYMNLMYIFGSHIIATFSGKTFEDFVKERIFDPLNMTATTYSPQEANATELLTQSWAFNGRRIPFIFDEPTAELVAGAGGIISNAVDMAKWAATILNGGVDPVTNKTIIPARLLAETTAARVVETGTTPDPAMSIIGYGLGWERKSFFGHNIISHDGGIPGFVSTIKVLPDDNMAVVSLLNTESPFQDVIPFSIMHALLEPDEPFDPLARLRPSSASSSSSTIPSTPADPSANCTSADSDIPLENFAGVYVNPGYGNLTFCAPSQADVSAYCQSALSDLAAVSPNGTVEPHTLVAVSPRIVTHATMQRTCAGAPGSGIETFVLLLESIYASGYGRNTTPFAVPRPTILQQADVECVVDADGKISGCGWVNLMPGNPRTGTLQERADVWWDKN
ncbi:beta-lactamase/transpeptidase-like protein [Daedaleopsis nitida]|nr:beta-lactamase/transpeptidase-like protein [Daedaleopsis nitida]